MLKAFRAFLKRLFKPSKKEISNECQKPVNEETSDSNNCTVTDALQANSDQLSCWAPIQAADEKDHNDRIYSAECLKENIKSQEDQSSECEVEKNECEIKENKNYIEFTKEDKDEVLAIIRPIVKDINTFESYKVFCESVEEEPKTLKIFSMMTDDGKEIGIKLTQSPKFNDKLVNYIEDQIASLLAYCINREKPSEYEVDVCKEDCFPIKIKKII